MLAQMSLPPSQRHAWSSLHAVVPASASWCTLLHAGFNKVCQRTTEVHELNSTSQRVRTPLACSYRQVCIARRLLPCLLSDLQRWVSAAALAVGGVAELWPGAQTSLAASIRFGGRFFYSIPVTPNQPHNIRYASNLELQLGVVPRYYTKCSVRTMLVRQYMLLCGSAIHAEWLQPTLVAWGIMASRLHFSVAKRPSMLALSGNWNPCTKSALCLKRFQRHSSDAACGIDTTMPP